MVIIIIIITIIIIVVTRPMLRWSRRLCTRGASRGNRLSVLPASTAILPSTGGNLSFGFARRSLFDDNDNDVVGPVDLFLGGIVNIDFFLILSTGHGAYLTGRSAAQLMIRLATVSFIVIIVDHHSHQKHHKHHLHCDLYHWFFDGVTKLWFLQNCERQQQLWKRDNVQSTGRLCLRPQCLASRGIIRPGSPSSSSDVVRLPFQTYFGQNFSLLNSGYSAGKG